MPSWLNAVPHEPIGQRRRVAEAQELGGARLVAAGGFHGLLQIVSRDAVDDAIEINPVADISGEDVVPCWVWGRARQQGGASSTSTTGPGVQTAARRKVLRISRTLPGQG